MSGMWFALLGLAAFLLVYAYAGYPVLIWALSRWRGRPVRKGVFAGGVSVLIAARNEAGALPAKLVNLLQLARTEPVREIWIGLDGCTDGTGERVRETIDQRLETKDQRREIGDPCRESAVYSLQSGPYVGILEFERQRGKAAILNELMARAAQPVLVMMDARQRVEEGAISRLVENFADPQVGVVSGELVYEPAVGGAQKGAESYWGYEKFLRRSESRFWAVPGATGALYAIRRELCQPIPENTLVDDVMIPMRACMAGYRCLFEPSARVFDRPTDHFSREGARKRRTLAGIWQLMRLEPKLSSVSANPIWFQWVSHKVLRLFTPFLVLVSLLALAFLAWQERGVWTWGFLVAAGGSLFSLAAYGTARKTPSRILGILGAFAGVNWALIQAAGDAWAGRFEARWKR